MYRSDFYTSEEILDGIKNNNRLVITFVYTNYYPVISYILKRDYGVSSDRCRDYFQEAMLAIFTCLHTHNPFSIHYSFITYLLVICKRRMLDEMKRKKEVKINLNKHEIPDPSFTANEILIKDERIKLVHRHFIKLGEKCRKIMTLFLKGFSTREITEKLNMSSEHYTKKRRQLCKVTLFKSIVNDQTYKELTDGKSRIVRKLP
jgi:RNA polymerase sigma factor (sigma-70 family)